MSFDRELLLNPQSALLWVLCAGALGTGCGGGESPSPEPLLATRTQAVMNKTHDYLFIRSPMTWDKAGALCDSLGYGLVTVNDAAEEGFLSSLEGNSAWWLGGRYSSAAGGFVWRNDTSSYNAWRPSEPNVVGYFGDNDCIFDNYNNYKLGQWDDNPCSYTYFFICESLN